MTADELYICNYLKGYPGQFVSLTEISRRASGKRRAQREPNWALVPLERLVETGVLEMNSDCRYRLKRRESKKEGKKWLSPQMRKILETSGKKFDAVLEVDDTEGVV